VVAKALRLSISIHAYMLDISIFRLLSIFYNMPDFTMSDFKCFMYVGVMRSHFSLIRKSKIDHAAIELIKNQ